MFGVRFESVPLRLYYFFEQGFISVFNFSGVALLSCVTLLNNKIVLHNQSC